MIHKRRKILFAEFYTAFYKCPCGFPLSQKMKLSATCPFQFHSIICSSIYSDTPYRFVFCRSTFASSMLETFGNWRLRLFPSHTSTLSFFQTLQTSVRDGINFQKFNSIWFLKRYVSRRDITRKIIDFHGLMDPYI